MHNKTPNEKQTAQLARHALYFLSTAGPKNESQRRPNRKRRGKTTPTDSTDS